MTDSYYDDIVRIAIGVPGVRLALDSGRDYGLNFETDNDPSEVAEELRERFRQRAWRVQREAYMVDEASMYVISEIDRGVNVFVTRPVTVGPGSHER